LIKVIVGRSTSFGFVNDFVRQNLSARASTCQILKFVNCAYYIISCLLIKNISCGMILC